MTKIKVNYVKTYSDMIAINEQNYKKDCYACNCLRYCYIHKYGYSVKPNLEYIKEHGVNKAVTV